MLQKNHNLKSSISPPASPDDEEMFNLNLDMNYFPIKNIKSDPGDPTALSTKKSTQTFIKEEIIKLNTDTLVPRTGTVTGKEITGNIVFDGCTITGIANPTNDNELSNQITASNLIQTSVNSLLKLSGGTISGNIDMQNHTISGLPSTPPDNDSAVSLIALKNTIDDTTGKYLTYEGSPQIITGNLVFSSAKITDIPNPIDDDDLINLEYMNKSINAATDNYLKISGSVMHGNINMNNFKVTNVPLVTTSNDAANFLCIKNNVNTITNPYFPLSGGILTGTLTTAGKFTGVGNATELTDAVNFGQFQSALLKLVPLNGSRTITGNLDMSGNKITDIINPVTGADVVSKIYTQNSFIAMIPLSGTVTNSEITGNIAFNTTTTATGIPEATVDSSAINFLQLKNNIQTSFNSYIKLDGTVPMTGNINAGGFRITNVAPSTTGTDAVNQEEMQNKINADILNYLPLNSSRIMLGPLHSTNQPITISPGTATTDGVNFTQFNNEAKKNMSLSGGTFTQPQIITGVISNLGDGTNSDDIVNLGQLENILSTKIPLTGGTISGNIDMQTHTISGLTPGIDNADAINKQQLDDSLNNITNNFVKLDGTNTQTSFTGTLNMGNNPIENLGNYVAGTSQSTDAINQTSLNILTTTISTPYFYANKDVLSGNLNMNGNPLNNAANPVNDYDLINEQTLLAETSKYLSLSGDSLSRVLTLSATANINNLAAGTAPTDAVNGAQLNASLATINDSSFINRTGATMEGALNMGTTNKITNVQNTSNNGDLINLGVTQTKINADVLNYLPIDGTRPMLGFLNMGGNTLTGLRNGTNPSDGINYDQLTTGSDSCLPLSGGELTQLLTLTGSSKITNLADPTNSADGCNLQTMTSILDSKISDYLKLDGSLPMLRKLNMNGNTITTTKLSADTTDNDLCTLSSMQLSMSPYALATGATFKGNVSLKGIAELANPTNSDQLVSKQLLDAEVNPVFRAKLNTYVGVGTYTSWPANSYANWTWYTKLQYQSTTDNFVIGGPGNSNLYLTHSGLYLLNLFISAALSAATSKVVLELHLNLNDTATRLLQIQLLGSTESAICSLIPCRFPKTSTSAYLTLKTIGAAGLRNMTWSLVSICGIYQ